MSSGVNRISHLKSRGNSVVVLSLILTVSRTLNVKDSFASTDVSTDLGLL